MTFNEREREIEARLRRAMTEHTAAVPELPDRWSAIEAAAAGSRRRDRRRDHRRRYAVAALSHHEGASPFMTLMAAFQALPLEAFAFVAPLTVAYPDAFADPPSQPR